jgi:hypothetical protein
MGTPMTFDRRAPIRASLSVDTDPKQLRGSLEAIRRDLATEDPAVSRKVVLLVGVLTDEWLRHSVPAEEPLQLEIETKEDAIRVEATIPDWDGEPEFWTRVGETLSIGIVDRWGIDQRRRSGAWFEIEC